MVPKTIRRPFCWLLLVGGLLCVGSMLVLILLVYIPGVQRSNLQATQTALQFFQDQATAYATTAA